MEVHEEHPSRVKTYAKRSPTILLKFATSVYRTLRYFPEMRGLSGVSLQWWEKKGFPCWFSTLRVAAPDMWWVSGEALGLKEVINTTRDRIDLKRLVEDRVNPCPDGLVKVYVFRTVDIQHDDGKVMAHFFQSRQPLNNAF